MKTLGDMREKAKAGSSGVKMPVRYDGMEIPPEALKVIYAIGKQSSYSDKDFEDSQDIPHPSCEHSQEVSGSYSPSVDEKALNETLVELSKLIISQEEKSAISKAINQGHISTPTEVKAFVRGYRMKQDYINVLLAKQTKDLKNVIGRLGSMASSVNASVTNLDTGVAHALAKIGSAMEKEGELGRRVVSWVEAIRQSSTAVMDKQYASPIPQQQLGHSVTPPMTPKSLKTEHERLIEENQQLSEGMKYDENLWTAEEISELLGENLDGIYEFYGTTWEKLLKIVKDCNSGRERKPSSSFISLKSAVLDRLNK